MKRTTTLLAILLVIGAIGCADRSGGPQATVAETPVGDSARSPLFPAPAFVLTDQLGQPFDSSTLDGELWIASFIFTRCEGICPAMTARMASLRGRLADRGRTLRSVSFSVDPTYDTPEVLANYAATYEADPNSWHFLTGTREQLWKISEDGFKLGVGDDPLNEEMPIVHSQKFIIVDENGQVLKYYDALTREGFRTLLGDLAMLMDEPGLAE